MICLRMDIVPDVLLYQCFRDVLQVSSLKELFLAKENPQEVHLRSEAVRIVLLMQLTMKYPKKATPRLAVRSCLLSLRCSLKNVCRSNKHEEYLTVHFLSVLTEMRTLTNHYRHNCYLSTDLFSFYRSFTDYFEITDILLYKWRFIVNIELGLVYDAMSNLMFLPSSLS